MMGMMVKTLSIPGVMMGMMVKTVSIPTPCERACGYPS
jgi:hypothetical protein